ncbi:nucleotidyltransferase domain-containing protein [Streptomyces kronopolitis]|uniref:nucleotidyltransferase domain-containing protein n=1 Tax=Streptomyces kronopolitis TaxID=1612435 RepID=UPI0020C0EA3B|nr:nucleotidyltransferase domain-containing protein [Streptomyces kronopolitis]MCL6302922.1 nucleotidyltransferase domain-containing protein [Streptomyces kronopolitis]
MKGERATSLLNDMLDRLEEGGWPLDLVDEILVFGSYTRGALNPSDVDLVVEHRTDDRSPPSSSTPCPTAATSPPR